MRIYWIAHANTSREGASDWPGFFDHFVSDEARERTIAGLAPGADGQKLWPELEVAEDDTILFKNRYSALIAGSSSLETMARGRGIDTLLIGGTKTDVCWRIDRARRHDARFQNRDARRLLRRALPTRSTAMR